MEHVETWMDEQIRPAFPGWTRHGQCLFAPAEADLVRVVRVVVYCTRTTLEAWVAPLCVPWQIGLFGPREFFAARLPGEWPQHRPESAPKICRAIQRFLPKLDGQRMLKDWVRANARYLPPGGHALGYSGDASSFEAIALPLIALGDNDRAARLLGRGLKMAGRRHRRGDETPGGRRIRERMTAVRRALDVDPAAARRKLAAFRRQNVRHYGLAPAVR